MAIELIATVATAAGASIGWWARHFSNKNGNGNSASRDDIRWQEEMRSMTKSIGGAVKDGNKDLTDALDKVAAELGRVGMELSRIGDLAHETHNRVKRIEHHTFNQRPLHQERREGSHG